MTTFRLDYTETAARTRDAMKPERRALLERGLAILLEDPYPASSTWVGTNTDDRKVQVAPGLMIEYVIVQGYVVIIVIEIFDESLYLPEEETA